jgi:hypothetical protein
MPIAATCPKCSQMCQVEDQYAGMMVRCPRCGDTIQVARPGSAAVSAAPPAAAPPPQSVSASAPPPPLPSPGAPVGPEPPGLMETIQLSATIFGLDALSMKLIYAGLGCFAAVLLSTLMPWFSIFFGGPVAIVLGIQTGIGWITILLTLGAGGFVVVVFLALKQKNLLDISLWVAAGWGGLAFLWLLVNVAQWGGSFGIYLALLASLGAAGTFGYVVFLRLTQKKAY